jgi:hypothetical protein
MADRRRQWLTRTGVAVVAVALLLPGLRMAALGNETTARPADGGAAASGADGSPRSSTGGARATGGATGAASARAVDGMGAGGMLPPMGAFTDSGEEGVRSLAALQTWLGGTPVRVGHTYLPGDHWESIEGDTGILQPWADWQRAAHGRLFVLNVPMQADNESDLSDDEVRGLIRQGAAGDFDVHFSRLARHLVDLGVPDTVIVLGWEMNGATYTHRCGPDPAGWKAYWNRIVAAMRAVPGQHFRFDFAPNRGLDAIAWTACYPGDAAVDIIGMDSYDQPADASFFKQVTEPYGLQAQVDFAAAHRKAISYPEWGLFRNGDDPDYVSLMLAWIAGHQPLYQTITDYCPHGVWQCKENPRSTGVYRGLLYGRKTWSAAPPAATAPAPSPVPTSSHDQAARPAATAPGEPAVPTAVPLPSGLPTGATTPGWAARPGEWLPQDTPTLQSCMPMELSAEQSKSYESGQVCIQLRQRSGR